MLSERYQDMLTKCMEDFKFKEYLENTAEVVTYQQEKIYNKPLNLLKHSKAKKDANKAQNLKPKSSEESSL